MWLYYRDSIREQHQNQILLHFYEIELLLDKDHESQGSRNTHNKRKNRRGDKSLDLCKSTDLSIANRGKPEDLFGKSTYNNWNGSSV